MNGRRTWCRRGAWLLPAVLLIGCAQHVSPARDSASAGLAATQGQQIARIGPVGSSCGGVAVGATCTADVALSGNTTAYTGASFGVTMPGFDLVDVTPGAAAASCTLANTKANVGLLCAAGGSGDGTVAVLTFNRTAPGATTLSITNPVLATASIPSQDLALSGGQLVVAATGDAVSLTPTGSSCGSVAVGATCTADVALSGNTTAYTGASFGVTMPGFDLVDVTAAADCTVAKTRASVGFICATGKTGNGTVAVLTFNRTAPGATTLSVTNPVLASASIPSQDLALGGGQLALQ